MVDISLSFSNEKISEDKTLVAGESSRLRLVPQLKQSLESAACYDGDTKSNLFSENEEENNHPFDHGGDAGLLSSGELDKENNMHNADFGSINEQGASSAPVLSEGSKSQFSCVDGQEKETPLQDTGGSGPLPISELEMDNNMNDADFASVDEQWTPSAPHSLAPAVPESPKSLFRCGDDQEKKRSPQSSALLDLQLISESRKQINVLDTSCASEKSQLERQQCVGLMPQLGSGMSIWKRRANSACVLIQRSKGRSSKSCIDFDRKSQSQKSSSIGPLSECNSASTDRVKELIFTPDNENSTPDALQKKSSKKTTYDL